MEESCTECVFPLTKEESTGFCPTDTSLTYAAANGKLSCLKELIATGADVNVACKCHGNGALLSAAAEGHLDCGMELINAGADVNIKNKFQQSAITLCRRERKCGLCKNVDFQRC